MALILFTVLFTYFTVSQTVGTSVADYGKHNILTHNARVGWLLAVVAKMLTSGFSILYYLPADVFSPPNMRVFCIVCGHFPSCKAVWLGCERFSEVWNTARKLSPAAPECCYSYVGELLQLSRSVAPGLLEKVYGRSGKSCSVPLRLLCQRFM